MKKWIAIGDSFTYIDANLDEAGGRIQKGYLTRTLEKLTDVELLNLGINGSNTARGCRPDDLRRAPSVRRGL